MTLEKQKPLLPRWLTERFVRTEPKENPANQNIATIRDQFNQLLLGAQSISPNTWFTIEQPITLITRSSSQIDRHLHYSLQKGTSENDCDMLCTLQIQKENYDDWIAHRTLYIDILNAEQIGFYIDIASRSETAFGWEGNRFGTSLILLSHAVIEHLMTHLTQFERLPVKVTMTDHSQGQFLSFKHRRGWTSNQAKTLGYEEVEPQEFVKWYHRG